LQNKHNNCTFDENRRKTFLPDENRSLESFERIQYHSEKEDIRRVFRIFLPAFLYAAFNNFFRQIKPDSGK
jgi:hypothetical protein